MIVVTVSCTIIVITQFLLQTTFPHVGSTTGDDSVNLASLSSYFRFEESKYQPQHLITG